MPLTQCTPVRLIQILARVDTDIPKALEALQDCVPKILERVQGEDQNMRNEGRTIDFDLNYVEVHVVVGVEKCRTTGIDLADKEGSCAYCEKDR